MRNDVVKGTILAAVLALVLNLIIYFVGASRGVSYLTQQPGTVGSGMVIVASLVTAVAAGIGLWLLARFMKNPLNLFMWLAGILALLSLLLPYAMAHDTGTFVALGLMHVSSGLAIVYALVNYFQRCPTCN
ncbi:MAG: hypothetical protein H6667_15910 [Ardenticatenaceae bacterium]|nr:hypothetical protein [Ardenticatenaceae bacterium]MCB9443693.1 hypothetical protein [Ardenticatenaceae bacterium]